MHHKHRLQIGVRRSVALRMASKQIQAGRASCGPPLGMAADAGKPAWGWHGVLFHTQCLPGALTHSWGF